MSCFNQLISQIYWFATFYDPRLVLISNTASSWISVAEMVNVGNTIRQASSQRANAVAPFHRPLKAYLNLGPSNDSDKSFRWCEMKSWSLAGIQLSRDLQETARSKHLLAWTGCCAGVSCNWQNKETFKDKSVSLDLTTKVMTGWGGVRNQEQKVPQKRSNQ